MTKVIQWEQVVVKKRNITDLDYEKSDDERVTPVTSYKNGKDQISSLIVETFKTYKGKRVWERKEIPHSPIKCLRCGYANNSIYKNGIFCEECVWFEAK